MKRKQNTQWGIIGLLILMIPFSQIVNFHLRNSNPIDLVTLNNYEDKKTVLDAVKSTDYTPDFTGNGEACDIALAQSLVDTSGITISNASDPLNNTFYEPCPVVQNFSSSFVNMTIEDIYAPNKTLIIEDGPADDISDDLATKAYLTSFTTNGSCLLTNGSFELSISGSPIVHVYLFNSTWNSTMSRSEPDTGSETILTSGTPTITGWHEFDLLDTFLNNSKTKNNTWFVGLYRSSPTGTARWRFKYTGTDNSEAYTYDGLYLIHLNEYYLCKIGVAPYITPPNQTLIVEDDTADDVKQLAVSDPHATSFQVDGVGYLENISLHVIGEGGGDGNIQIYLLNSTWQASYKRSIPNETINVDNQIGDLFVPNGDNGWFDLLSVHEPLDYSKTENNTWFIAINNGGSFQNLYWYYTNDWETGSGSTDWDNETFSWYYQDSAWYYQMDDLPNEHISVDFHMKLELSPERNTPHPSNIGLRVNNTAVKGKTNSYGSGYWSSTNEYSSLSGSLGFTLVADWWDVACTITFIHITYTKTDVTAQANFSIGGSGQEVVWNVTDNEGLNYLDPRITESVTINFTIPASWKNINVFNGPINKTADISIKSLNNGYDEICVLSAGSGDWFLTASSANLLEAIDTYVDLTSTNEVTFSDIVTFNATFKEQITQDDGIIQLSVYSPAAINNKLNYTFIKSVFDSGLELSLETWDVSDNVTDYGEFRVQISWNNETAAAFKETILIILGQTVLTLIEPDQEATYYTNETFNIIVYYEDSKQLKAIDDTTLFYNIDTQSQRSTTTNNGSIGYYTIPIDCSSFTTNGTKKVDITATKDYYLNQTLRYDFNIIVIEEDGGPTKTPPPDITPVIILGLSTVIVLGVVGYIKREALTKGLSAMVQRIRPPKEDQ